MSSFHNQPFVQDINTTFETTQKQNWSKFHDELCSIPIDDYMDNFKSVNPIELSDEDIPVFGLIPRLENCLLISCSKCSMVVKRDCLHYHYNRRHNDPKNDNFSLGHFILPTVKNNKHKKQKINVRKIPEKKVTYSDSTDPIALDIIKLEFNEEDFNKFQVKIEQEDENHYDSAKYDDDYYASDVNLEIQSSSTSTINYNDSDWIYEPHSQNLFQYTDDILFNESSIEDTYSELNQLSTAELIIKTELEPIINDKSSDPIDSKNKIISLENSNESLTDSIDSSKNLQDYKYVYSGFLFDDYDEIYNDPVSSKIEYSKSSSYLDVSNTNANEIVGYNQHSTSSFVVEKKKNHLLWNKVMFSPPNNQYQIKNEFFDDDDPISDQQIITPVIHIKEEYMETNYSNIVNNNYSITCDQSPGITETCNISETNSISKNLDASIGISNKIQTIRCKPPSELYKTSRINNTKRKSHHSLDYSQPAANIKNKKIKLTSNTKFLDLQTLSPSYQYLDINDISSYIKPVNSYNQLLNFTLNQLQPVILNNETQTKLPACNNSIFNEFSEDISGNDKTKCVQINKCKVVIDNDNVVSRNYQSSTLHKFKVNNCTIISDIDYVIDDYDYKQCPISFINVKDRLKYPLFIDNPGKNYDGISNNVYYQLVLNFTLDEKEIDKICLSYTDYDFTNTEINCTSLISDEEKKQKYLHYTNTENLICTDFKKEPDEVIRNSQDSDMGIIKIKNEINSGNENVHLKKTRSELFKLLMKAIRSDSEYVENTSDKKNPDEINENLENTDFFRICDENYENNINSDDLVTEHFQINKLKPKLSDYGFYFINEKEEYNKLNKKLIDFFILDDKEKNESMNTFSNSLNTNDEKTLLTPSIKFADVINNDSSDAFINNNKLQIASLSNNVDSKYIPIIDYSDIIIDNETDNFENELNDSELLINQAQSSCISNSKDLDTISNGSSHDSVTSFDELSSVTSLDNEEIELISKDCVSDDENSNDSVTSDDQSSTESQDIIKKPKSITQTDLFLNHINYQKFSNPVTWTDESIVKSLEVLNCKTECINCYNAARDLLDIYFPVNSNTEIVDDFINSFTSVNSDVATTEYPVKFSIPVNSNVQMPINYLSPVSSGAQIVKNTISTKNHELLDCDNCNYYVPNNSYYLSSFHTFKWISKSENNHTSFADCLTHNCIIEKNCYTGNNFKTYSSEPYVDKPKQNENILNRNTINELNYINKNHAICKNHLKRITDKKIVFSKHCKIIPYKYHNIEAKVKKRLHRPLEGQVIDDKENNNQLKTRSLKKLKRVNFVMRKKMSCSDESDNDNVNE